MLYLVRHGRTEANASGRLLGRLDVALDDVGRAQARALADALPPGAPVVASPLLRTRETAAAIAGSTEAVEVDERWIELDYGELDGVPLRDVDAAVWARWRSDLDYRPPGGESLRQLGRRVAAACDALADAAQAGDVVVVTHVSPIKAAIAWALGVGDEVTWRLFVTPGSISKVRVVDRGAVVESFNETGHLPS